MIVSADCQLSCLNRAGNYCPNSFRDLKVGGFLSGKNVFVVFCTCHIFVIATCCSLSSAHCFGWAEPQRRRD